MGKPLADVSIEAQISEVKREIGLRQRVYPNRVMSQRMSQADADKHMARMKAVLATLEAVQRKELLI
jgi:hypothetical protein